MTYSMTEHCQDIINQVINFLEFFLKAARAGNLGFVGNDFLDHLFELVEQNHLLLEKFFVLKKIGQSAYEIIILNENSFQCYII